MRLSFSIGTSESVRKPCATVAPDGDFLRGALGINVNPLVIAGRLGEPIDPFLTDFHPVGTATSRPSQVSEGWRRVFASEVCSVILRPLRRSICVTDTNPRATAY